MLLLPRIRDISGSFLCSKVGSTELRFGSVPPAKCRKQATVDSIQILHNLLSRNRPPSSRYILYMYNTLHILYIYIYILHIRHGARGVVVG
jgi:hypothetical protein